MKKIIFAVVIICLFSCPLIAAKYLGKIVQINGIVDLTDSFSGEQSVPNLGTKIDKYHRVRTGNKSYAEILLNDGTKVFLHELSVLNVSSLRLKKNDSPTRIKVLTGKIRININRPLSGRNLILETPTALIGAPSLETDFGIISSKNESKVVVFKGQLDVANINRDVLKSYRLHKKEESIIRLNKPPSEPITLPTEVIGIWFDYYEIVDKDRIRIKGQIQDGIIGHILRKRNF